MTGSPDRGLYASLLAILLLLPLPGGANSVLTTAALGLAVAVLCLLRLRLAARGLTPHRATPALRRVLSLGWVWLALVALQLAPLPSAVVRILSPAAFALQESSAGTMSLTIAPGVTAAALILSATYLALFWLTAVLVARDRQRQRGVLLALLVSGAAQALYGSLMTLSGLEYGAFFAAKTFALGRATGTFVNPNHFAGYLELALAAGIALILADLQPRATPTWRERLVAVIDLALSRRLQVRLALLIIVVALVLTRSRAGNIAFVAALALSANLWVLLRARPYLLRSLLLFASLIAVDLLVVSRWYGLERLAARLENTDLATEQRTLAWQDLAPAIADYPVTGSGLGTFGVAFTPYRSPALHGYYDHAHNDHLEFVLETGWAGYALLLAIAALAIRHAWALVRHRQERAAAALGFAGGMGLTTIGLHGFADFNLHIPAVAASLVVMLATMLSCSAHRAARDEPA